MLVGRVIDLAFPPEAAACGVFRPTGNTDAAQGTDRAITVVVTDNVAALEARFVVRTLGDGLGVSGTDCSPSFGLSASNIHNDPGTSDISSALVDCSSPDRKRNLPLLTTHVSGRLPTSSSSSSGSTVGLPSQNSPHPA